MAAVLLVALVSAAFAVFFVAYYLVARGTPSSPADKPEALILEEAELVEALAPGLEGKARVLRRAAGSARDGIAGKSLEVRVRGADESSAFTRGTRVRLIDWRAGVFLVEAADAEHLVH
jgi:hypothetical protein